VKKLFSVFCFALFIVLFSLSSVYAQQLKIGIFETQRIMRESKTVQNYRMKLETEIGAKKNRLTQKQNEAKATEDKLRKDEKTLSLDEKKRLGEMLETQTRDLRRLREDLEAELQKMERDLSERALKDIGQVINDLAARENYDIVFERSLAGITFRKDAFDITGKIIMIYDAKK
jgi:outer membrane protein